MQLLTNPAETLFHPNLKSLIKRAFQGGGQASEDPVRIRRRTDGIEAWREFGMKRV